MPNSKSSSNNYNSSYYNPFDYILVERVSSISKMLRIIFGVHLAKINVVPGQDQLLMTLDKEIPQSVGDLCFKLNVRPPTISKMATILMHKGWVDRSTSPKDARVAHLKLTEEGAAVCERIRTVWKELEAELRPMLADNELRSVILMDAILMKRLRRLR